MREDASARAKDEIDPAEISEDSSWGSEWEWETWSEDDLAKLVRNASVVIPSKADQPPDVSMVQLIANPEKFDGKHIRVIGFLRIEFEGNALYFHREDYEIGLLKNAIWVDVTPEMQKQSSKFNMQYVLLEGIFSGSEKGHMDAFSGSIKHINRAMPWPSRRSQ
jgi:hypothetical protein